MSKTILSRVKGMEVMIITILGKEYLRSTLWRVLAIALIKQWIDAEIGNRISPDQLTILEVL